MKRVLLSLMGWCVLTVSTHAQADEITVNGLLRYGVNAIGGETTGIEITNLIFETYDLIIEDPEMLKLAESLDQKLATASGTLVIIPGLERPDRRAIKVKSLVPYDVPTDAQVCYSKHSQYRAVVADKAEIFHGKEHLSTLVCSEDNAEKVCVETQIVDAGYQLQVRGNQADLYEVFFWGTELLDRLECK